jgi:chromosomal replication initiator protein
VRIHGKANEPITLDKIIWAVCKVSGLTENELFSPARKRYVLWFRHYVAYLAIKHTRETFKSIGQRIGGRDHSTVINANKKIKDYLSCNDQLIISQIKQIETLL